MTVLRHQIKLFCLHNGPTCSSPSQNSILETIIEKGLKLLPHGALCFSVIFSKFAQWRHVWFKIPILQIISLFSLLKIHKLQSTQKTLTIVGNSFPWKKMAICPSRTQPNPPLPRSRKTFAVAYGKNGSWGIRPGTCDWQWEGGLESPVHNHLHQACPSQLIYPISLNPPATLDSSYSHVSTYDIMPIDYP